MRIRELLKTSGLPTLDSEVLLSHALTKPRTWLSAHDDEEVSDTDMRRFQELVRRRKTREPVSYITGQKEFYGRTFFVTPEVLIPRPATEELVRYALDFLSNPRLIEEEIDSEISALCVPLNPGTPEIIVDIGTGSGCIAATLALEGRTEKILAVDVSQAAVDIARENFSNLGLNITSAVGDGASFVEAIHRPFVIVSNPPYIKEGAPLAHDVVGFEPHEALFAGVDGMSVLKALTVAASENPACLGIALELESGQTAVVKRLLGVM